ncbi:MAG: hypothetical protein J0H15_10810 [Xanthomonadales bacterium]|nr:hypothetical protein [Xanthomonadales bacterium]
MRAKKGGDDPRAIRTTQLTPVAPAPTWLNVASILPEARAFLLLFEPPAIPVEFPAFLDGARAALVALSPHEVRYKGKPIRALLDHLGSAILADARGTRSQWTQDLMRGYGLTPYRALVQPPALGSEGGYAVLKAILLGCLLIRARDAKAISLKVIEQMARFIRLGSREVHDGYGVARARFIASLPSTLVPRLLQEALANRDGVPEALHPRLDEVAQANEKLLRSFWILDRGDQSTEPRVEQPIHGVPTRVPLSPGPYPKPNRRRPRAPNRHPPSVTSAGVERPDAAFIYGPANRPSADTAEAIAGAAEAIDDSTPLVESLVMEASPSVSAVKRRATALRLLSDVRQGFWARYQWDALSPGEMRDAVGRLLAELSRLEHAPDATRHEALTLGLLSASTGLPRARCHAIRTQSAEDDGSPPDVLRLDTGTLSLPLVGEQDRFKPKPEQLRYLQEVGDAVPIHLPNEVVAELRKLTPPIDGYVFRTDLTILEQIIDSAFCAARGEEPRITAARLFRGHQLEVLAQCGDPASAQMVTGQTLGTPPVGLSYYSAMPGTLQNIYNRAVVNHGLTPNDTTELPSHLVGSKLALTDETLKAAVQSVSRGLLNRPRVQRTAGREILYLQNDLALATAWIWMAGTGFRPTFRLGEVRASWINWLSQSAVIVDKVTDAAHEGRLVPLAPTLMQTLAAYGAVLELMSRSQDISLVARTGAHHAITGEGPLFFIIDKRGKVCPLDAQTALTRLPANWNLPANFCRHRLASRLREVGCPGIYVQALMGHLEQGIQPFGPDSFLVPSEYLTITRNAIERVLQEDGWRPLLGGFGEVRSFLDHAPPATEEVMRVEAAHEQAVEIAFNRQRQEVDALRELDGDQIRTDALDAIGQVRLDLIKSPDQPHELDSAAVTALRLAVTANASSAALVELRIRVLRDYLAQGREDHGWRIKRLPQFFAFRPTPSVHHPTFIPAYLALERLRQHFLSRLNTAPGKTETSAALAKLNLLLALILWQGVASWDRMAKILQGLPEAEPISPDGVGIAVPIQISRFAQDPSPEPSSEVLTGVVALAALTAKAHISEVDRKELESLVGSWIPSRCVKSPKGRMLDVLFSIARIGHRFESPPPLRLVWSEQLRSVNLSVDRLRALFGLRASTTHTAAPCQAKEESASNQQCTDPASNRGAEEYKWLRAVLRAAKDSSQNFPAEPGEGTQANVADSGKRGRKRAPPRRHQLRADACRHLRARLEQWPFDGTLVRGLTAYALDRLEHGTPWSAQVVPDTVYNYVVGAGGALRAYDPEMHLEDLEEEDYAEIYRNIIRRAPIKYKETLTGYLAYFHRYLVEKRWAPPVAVGHAGDPITSLPEVGYIAPNEMADSVTGLESELGSSETLVDSVIEIRAVIAAISLGFAAGTRKKETLLRESRELVLDEGRRALLIRKNRWVTTKTHRSTRLIDLEPSMPAAGWAAISAWRENSSALRTVSEARHSMLFSESVDGQTPLGTERLTRRIAATLRHSTGRQDAQVNWWRHTAVSNDILVLFATQEVLDAVREGCSDAGTEWLPCSRQMRRSLGGDLPLGQAHAAGFRARRGHAQMQTPVSTYTHTAGLIEPWACRRASDELSSRAFASIAGLKPAALRQRLSRANLSASQPRLAVRYLIKAGAPSLHHALPHGLEESSDRTRMPGGSIDPEQISEALFRALREGDIQLMVNALHLTNAAAQHLIRRLGDSTRANVFGLHFGLDLPPAENDRGGVPRARAQPAAPLSFERVDRKWVSACLEARIANPGLESVWRTVLHGLDPRTGQIAVRSDQEFVATLNSLPAAIAQTEEARYRVGVVVDSSVSMAELTSIRRITEGTNSRGCHVHRVGVRAPKGWMLAGAVVETVATGRRRIAGLAFLALASVLLAASDASTAP